MYIYLNAQIRSCSLDVYLLAIKTKFSVRVLDHWFHKFIVFA